MTKIVINRLVWDKWNVAHIARHGVTRAEVEHVGRSDHVVLNAKKERLAIVGVTKAGRTLFVVLDPESEEGVYYPVTARFADKNERNRYLKEKGGESHDNQAI